MKKIIPLSIAISLLSLTACAPTKINSVTGSANSVEVNLDHNSNDYFFLNAKNNPNKIISNSKPNNYKLTFAIPQDYKSPKKDECYFVTTASGEVIGFAAGDTHGFANSLIYDYSQAADRINAIKANLAALENHGMSSTEDCLTKYASAKPVLACSPDEKTSKSIAICLINNLGCEGIGGVSGALVRTLFGKGVIKFLSGTGCDAIANELLGKNESALANAAKSLALGVLATSGGLIGAGIVGGIKLVDFKDCIDAVEDKCADKYNSYITTLKQHPECQNLVVMENKGNNSKESLLEELNAQNSQIQELGKKKINLMPTCTVP